MSVAALLLADGRFPAGGHAHSGGIEPAVTAGAVVDLAGLKQFLLGKLSTAGLTAAALAAAACEGVHDWKSLDAEADARIPSPALRASSRRQGRQLLRSALSLWPGELLESLNAAVTEGPHHPVAMGAAAAAAGLTRLEAARSAVYSTVAAPAGAAVKLLGLDPLSVHRLLAGLVAAMNKAAEDAARYSQMPLAELPCTGSMLADLYAEQHAICEVRLFAS